jgi:hypothetical protein
MPWTEHWEDSFVDAAASNDVVDQLYPHQKAVYEDQHRFRAILGGRRAGKTEEEAVEAITTAEAFPGEVVAYCAPTVTGGKDILWPVLERIQGRCPSLKLEYHSQRGVVTTPKGGIIQIFGLANLADADKGRGKRYPLVIIDECGMVPDKTLRRAATQTFGPATLDFRGRGGRGLLLCGTPGYVPNTYWHEVTGGNEHQSKYGCSVHFMTLRDNPLFVDPDQALKEIREEHRLLETDPAYLREWLGTWGVESVGLCYSNWDGKLLPRSLVPAMGWTSLGVDIGHRHPSAWVVVRMTHEVEKIGERMRVSSHAHVIDSYEQTDCDVHDIARITTQFLKAYSPGSIVGDSHGMGAIVIADLSRRFGVPIVKMEKADLKRDRIWLTNSMLGAGTLHVYEGAESLAEQFASIPWNEKVMDHHPNTPDHSADALLGALEDALQHVRETDLPPIPGSREAILAEAKRRKVEVLAAAARDRDAREARFRRSA